MAPPRPRLAIGVLALVLAFSLRESIRTADRTRPVFRELREAGALVASLPRRPVWADFHFHNAMLLRDLAHGRWRATTLGATPAERRAQIAAIGAGYLVTGGAREPYYGCRDCIARAAELDPSRWRLVHEWQAPPPDAPWWPEPLRLWERATPSR